MFSNNMLFQKYLTTYIATSHFYRTAGESSCTKTDEYSFIQIHLSGVLSF